MPHYILKLDDEGDGNAVALYSTIVDNLITDPATPAELKAKLEAQGGYETWFAGPWTPEKAIEHYKELVGSITPGMERHFREQARYWYWDEEAGIAFVKLSDAFFVLPRSDWRD